MDPFIIKIILSFFIAGLWISFATLLAEKFGSKIGGLIANLPSNILIAFIFVALTQGKQYTIKAALSVPLGMTIDAFFLFAYILGLYKNIITGLFLSLLSWLVLATLTIKYLQSTPIGLGIITYIVFTILIFYVLEKIIKIPSIQKQKKTFQLYSNYLQSNFCRKYCCRNSYVIFFLQSVLDRYLFHFSGCYAVNNVNSKYQPGSLLCSGCWKDHDNFFGKYCYL